jgi:hypothetical protein
MFKYGDKVKIMDGSSLNECEGVVYQIKDDKVYVLIDKEVMWPVTADALDLCGLPLTKISPES